MASPVVVLRRSLRAGRWWLAAAVAVAGSWAGARAAGTAFPGKGWESRAPEDLGLDPHRLDAVAQALGGRGCVVKDGYVVKSWGSQSEKSDWYSSAKPVLSTLLFFAIQEGKVEGVDSLVAGFGWDLRPKDRTMTFRHLASMTSGYARPDPPGAAWAYNDFAIQLYQKTLFDRVFREDPDAAANSPRRLGRLGLEDGLSFRKSNRRLSASVRDFARIAWLWLNRGQWDGQPVLSRRFFDDYLRPQVPPDLPHGSPGETNDYLKIGSYGGGSDHFTRSGPGTYGFNWWFNATGRDHPKHPTWPDAPADTFMAVGFGGNCAAVIPSLGVVVAAAEADWGPLAPGRADAVLNQRLRLIVHAATPAVKGSAAPQARATAVPDGRAVAVAGELKKWHAIRLTFRGPRTSETASPNVFRDFRLDVTFTHGGKSLTVPGYFAADGDAAESGAAEGNCWRVVFVPDEVGRWSWAASFRTGPDVAAADDARSGRPAAFDGASGVLDVAPSDKSRPDFRARGMLRYVGERYLRFAETGEAFLKGGADSPENFLAFADFDQTRPTHRYGPHELDYAPGDPTWRGGLGKNIIGALNYLAGKGVNSLYFLTMNVKGDGKDVWPWVSDSEPTRYDCSKLDQWEVVLAHMDRLGIMLHLVTQEQENDQLLDRGELGAQRRIYYRELIARFAHHPALTWNLGEENTNSDEQRKQFGRFFHRIDPYGHPVVVHTFPKKIEEIYPSALLGDASVEGASLQTNDTRNQTRRWIDRSAAAGRPWVVSLDEIGPADTGVKPDAVDFNHDEVRTRHLWPHLMAGGAGVEWLFGYKYAHHDVNLEDFRSRDHMWDLTRVAVAFFRRHLPFDRMRCADEYVDRPEACCLAQPGEVYAVYLPTGGAVRLWLPEARYSVRWYNPRRGGNLRQGSVPGIAGGGFRSLGQPPSDMDKDWVALVRLDGPPPTSIPPPR